MYPPTDIIWVMPIYCSSPAELAGDPLCIRHIGAAGLLALDGWQQQQLLVVYSVGGGGARGMKHGIK